MLRYPIVIVINYKYAWENVLSSVFMNNNIVHYVKLKYQSICVVNIFIDRQYSTPNSSFDGPLLCGHPMLSFVASTVLLDEYVALGVGGCDKLYN